MRLTSIVFFLALSASVLTAPTSAYALRERGYNAAGIILGDPTGFTGKFWLENHQAIDAGLAFSFNDFFMIYSDYLVHFPIHGSNHEPFIQQLLPYIGGGLVMIFSTDSTKRDGKLFRTSTESTGVGIRIPLGVEWQPNDPPIGVFVELVPGMGVIPRTFGFVQGGIGVRYYF